MGATSPSAESSIAVEVAEAEAYVRDLRGRFDPSAKLGMPAHITLLYPFMPPAQITEEVLERVRRAVSSAAAFSFRLLRIRRFPTALYLAPEPSEPFVALTEGLVRAFPGWLPYGGQYSAIVPHLTVAQAGEPEQSLVAAQLAAAFPAGIGVGASCREVVLFENSSGRWERKRAFPLPLQRVG